MNKTLADLLRLFIVLNLIVLAFQLLPNAAPARQQAAAATSHAQAKTLFVEHANATQCQKPGNTPWQPAYQTTAYHYTALNPVQGGSGR